MADQSSPEGHRQRLRERFLAGKPEAHSDEALLELLLTYAIPRRDVKPLAHKMISTFGDLSSVLKTSPEALCKSIGIKISSATLIKLVNYIHSEHSDEPTEAGQEVTAPRPVPEKYEGQVSLFQGATEEAASKIDGQAKPSKAKVSRTRTTPIPSRGTGLFSIGLLKEAIDLLPSLPETESLDEVKDHIRSNLRCNAEQTRDRYTSYIIRRMFPDGYADYALRAFAKCFRDTRDLKEVCYYRFIKAEPLIQRVVTDLFLPSIGKGSIHRARLIDYLTDLYPSSRSIGKSARAIAEVLSSGGVAASNKDELSFGYRDIPLPTFAFIVHSEFAEPGMYDLSKLENNATIRAMLWRPDRVLPALYELRNTGVISKISEIDSVRQFTLKFSLQKAVEYITASGEQR